MNRVERSYGSLNIKDQKSLKEVFDVLYTPLCLFSHKIVGSLDVAEDVVQEVFTILLEKDIYKNFEGKIKSYLFTSVKNISLNYLRNKKLKACEWIDEYGDVYEDLDDIDIRNELIDKAKKALEELPDGCQAIFKTIVIDGSSYKEAANIHGISINTIKSQLKRAVRLLSEKLDHLSFILLMEILFKNI